MKLESLVQLRTGDLIFHLRKLGMKGEKYYIPYLIVSDAYWVKHTSGSKEVRFLVWDPANGRRRELIFNDLMVEDFPWTLNP